MFSSDLARAAQTASVAFAGSVARVGRFLTDLPLRWNEQRIIVIGHVATRWGLDHFISGAP